jgi:hypothetical protein
MTLSLSVIVKQCPHRAQSTRSDCVVCRHAFQCRRCIVIGPWSPVLPAAGGAYSLGRAARGACRRRKPDLHPAQRSCARLRSPPADAAAKLCEHAQSRTTACGLSATACGRSTTSCRRYVDVLWKLSDGLRTISPRPVAFTVYWRPVFTACIGARAFTARARRPC